MQKRNRREWYMPWKRLMAWGSILVSLLLLFLVLESWNSHQNLPVEIVLESKNHKIGDSIEILAKNVKKSEVEFCVWYVGEEVVSKTDKLVPYTTQKKDEEQFVRFEVFLKDGSVYRDGLYCSSLPVVYMECETSYRDLELIPEPAQIRIASGVYTSPEELYQGEATIKLRGNSTRILEKVPFKIKLETKADLLGMGANKHWILLANALDASLLRNKLVYDLAGSLGAKTWMDSELVSVVYNGEYLGLYQLCEQVRVDEERVDIYNWEELAEEITEQIAAELVEEGVYIKELQVLLQERLEEEMKEDLSWIENRTVVFETLREVQNENGEPEIAYDLEPYLDFEALPKPEGGVLLEMDYVHGGKACLKTNYAQGFYFNRPYAGESYETLYTNIRQELQAMEYAFHDTDFRYHEEAPHYKVSNEGWFVYLDVMERYGVEYERAKFSAKPFDGMHYSEFIDFDSLMQNFLLCEITMNWDSMKNSVFLHKDVEGPFYFSPAWDYDWAWGNGTYGLDTWVTDDWQTTSNWFANEYYYQSVQWNRYLVRDPYFLVRIYEEYWKIRDTLLEDLIREDGLIDQYQEELLMAAAANDAKWGGCEGNYEGRKFEEGIAYLKLFLEERLAWMDKQFASIETLRTSLDYYMVSDSLQIAKVDTEAYEGETEILVKVMDPACAAVSFQVNGCWFYEAAAESGEAVVRIPDEALRPEKGALNTVQIRAMDEDGAYLINPEGTVEGDYTNAVSSYTYFTKELRVLGAK